jgi:hypothetical protein
MPRPEIGADISRNDHCEWGISIFWHKMAAHIHREISSENWPEHQNGAAPRPSGCQKYRVKGLATRTKSTIPRVSGKLPDCRPWTSIQKAPPALKSPDDTCGRMVLFRENFADSEDTDPGRSHPRGFWHWCKLDSAFYRWNFFNQLEIVWNDMRGFRDSLMRDRRCCFDILKSIKNY